MKTLTTIVLVLLSISLSAQSITRKKLIGKWKPVLMSFGGEDVRIDDKEAMMNLLTAQLAKVSDEDSATQREIIMAAHDMIRSERVEFKQNDSVYTTTEYFIEGKAHKDAEAQYYTVADGKLTRHRPGFDEIITLEMPDAKTLIFRESLSGVSRKLTFSKL